MYCENQIIHIIKPGETLYSIAKMYNSTPEEIMYLNPGIDPYYLRVAQKLVICLRYQAMSPVSPMPIMTNPNTRSSNNMQSMALNNKMRNLWEQHSMWTRLLIISIIDGLRDTAYVQKRILQNPVDFGNLYKKYYGEKVGNEIADIIKEHLVIGEKIIKATRKGDKATAEKYNKDWHKNADRWAAYFASINPHYNEQEMKTMLYKHLELVGDELEARAKGSYEKDVKEYDEAEEEALKMADYFTKGIERQFPNMF